MTVDLPGLAKWIADHPGRDKPWSPIDEERMAAAADGRSLRALPTDPAVKAGSHRWRRDEVGNVSTDGGYSWHFGGDSGDAA